jgi:predicted nucleotide-binding protein
LKDLSQFLDELKAYREILTNPNSELLEAKRKNELFAAFPFLQDALPQKSKEEVIEELRQDLIRKAGKYKDKIYKLTGKIYYTQFGQTREIWSNGLQKERLHTISEPPSISVLDLCIDATNEAIGKLEEGESWEVELPKKPEKVTKQPSKEIADKPKAFIAHEGETRALTMLKEFLEALGIQYFIAESKASDGRSIEKQVDWTQSKADFAICLATKGKAINKKTGKHYMAPNIADELGRARQVFGNKIILLVQKGVEPHTNIKEIVHETFTTTNMEKAFIKIVKELRNWGFITVGRTKE